MIRLGRICAVTAGLVAAGAVCGALAAALALALVFALMDGPAAALDDLQALGAAAVGGSMLGAVAAPVAAWLLLRRVPLGLAVAGTVVGAVAGGVAGFFLAPLAGTPVVFAVLGFWAAAGALHVLAPLGLWAPPRPAGRVDAG